VWVTSTLSQESAEKISDRSELRAKSYVRFTEGMSRWVRDRIGNGIGRVFLLSAELWVWWVVEVAIKVDQMAVKTR